MFSNLKISKLKNWIHEGVPWFYAQIPLLTKKWESGSIVEKLSVLKIPLWIKLRDVPMELVRSEDITRIARVLLDLLCIWIRQQKSVEGLVLLEYVLKLVVRMNCQTSLMLILKI